MKKGRVIVRFLIILGSFLLIISGAILFFIFQFSKSRIPEGNLDFSRFIGEKLPSREAPVSPDTARVFFTTDGRSLSPEIFPLSSDLTPYQRVEGLLKRLITGPASKYFEPTIPLNVKILGIFIDEDDITLDFSGELKTSLQGGVTQELLTIYSIVNTVALNVEGIRRVQILIDGKTTPLLSREIDIEKPLMTNLNLIRY
ncbi:GerMN domain-containing protein [Candidatus Sumerlaeota bacterium]|nr:GerMN domain-containing protein [Candidatus Sumerlaeota bacterium]